MELRRSGVLEECCRYIDVEVWSAGGAAGVPKWKHGGRVLDLRTRAAGVATWKHGGMELWGRAIRVVTLRYGTLDF